MWDASQHKGTEFLRTGEGDCNLVPSEIPNIMVVGKLQVSLPAEPLWGVLYQGCTCHLAASRLRTFHQENRGERKTCSSLHTIHSSPVCPDCIHLELSQGQVAPLKYTPLPKASWEL